jgi:hypothetical protein
VYKNLVQPKEILMETDLDKLMAQAICTARDAWYGRFKSCNNPGDGNREAVGRLAAQLFASATSDLPPDAVRTFLSKVEVTQR